MLSDLLFHAGARFGHVFEFHPMLVPYILGDALLVGAVEMFGPRAAATIWNTLTFLSLPAALVFYFRANNIRADTRVLMLIVALYLATDWFFVTALSEFRLGVALIIVAMGLADLLRSAPNARRYFAYTAVVVLGYLVHLAMPVFLVSVLGASGLLRLWLGSTTLRREAALFVPLVGVLAWHFGTASIWQRPDDLPVYPFSWGSLSMKIHLLLVQNFEFTRYGLHGTRLVMLAFALYMLWLVRDGLHREVLTRPRVLEMLMLAVIFVAVYFALPSMYSEAAYVDVRALVMISLFLLLACAYVLQETDAGRSILTGAFALPLAILLALINLACVAFPMLRDNTFADRYRAIVAAIPQGAYVLPVFTLEPEGTVRPFLHVGAFVVIDRGAISPYLFTGDRGAPVKYFRYTRRLYAPPEWWYDPSHVPTGETMVAWRAIACAYDFLLLTRPFKASYIGIPTRTVAENESASLLSVLNESYHCSRAERHP